MSQVALQARNTHKRACARAQAHEHTRTHAHTHTRAHTRRQTHALFLLQLRKSAFAVVEAPGKIAHRGAQPEANATVGVCPTSVQDARVQRKRRRRPSRHTPVRARVMNARARACKHAHVRALSHARTKTHTHTHPQASLHTCSPDMIGATNTFVRVRLVCFGACALAVLLVSLGRSSCCLRQACVRSVLLRGTQLYSLEN